MVIEVGGGGGGLKPFAHNALRYNLVSVMVDGIWVVTAMVNGK